MGKEGKKPKTKKVKTKVVVERDDKAYQKQGEEGKPKQFKSKKKKQAFVDDEPPEPSKPKISREERRAQMMVERAKKKAAAESAAASGMPADSSDEDEGGAEPRAAGAAEAYLEEDEEEESEEAAAARREAEAAKAAAREAALEESVAKAKLAAEKKMAKQKKAVDKALAKRNEGGKLSAKDKKLLASHDQQLEERKVEAALAANPLSAFSLVVAGAGAGAEESRTKDVHIDSFSISANKKPLFDDAELRLAHGRKYGVIGPNGQGKSTLLRFIAAGGAAKGGLPIPNHISCLYVEQEMKMAEDSLSPLQVVLAADKKGNKLLAEANALRVALGMEEDFIYGGGKAASDGAEPEVEEDDEEDDEFSEKMERLIEVYEELEAGGVASAEARARKILCGLGFSAAAQVAPMTRLSGGWKMRVSLARALFLAPELLLLDEPTNHLDLNAVLWLESYLRGMKHSTVLIVSHDQGFLDDTCTDVISLEDRKLVYYGPFKDDAYSRYHQSREQARLKKEKDLFKQQQDIDNLVKSGMSRKDAEEKYVTEQKRKGIEMVTTSKEYRVNFKFNDVSEERLDGLHISLKDVHFGYPGLDTEIFSGVTLDVNTSTRATIVGPNGVGKTTLMQLLTQELKPTKGEIGEGQNHLRVSHYHQHFDAELPPELSPVAFLCDTHKMKEHDARALLGRFGLEAHAHKIPVEHLSGGQKARLAWAHICMQRPHLLLLDEPTNHLDIESVNALIAAINGYGGGVVIVTHDAALIERTDCELWVVHGDGLVLSHEEGFDAYKQEVLDELDENAAAEDARAEERKIKRKAAAEAQLARRKA